MGQACGRFLSMNENKNEEPMAEKESDKVTCPSCSSRNVRVVSRKDNFRPRSQTGNLKTDLTPLSTTVSYSCQDQNCGHAWSAEEADERRSSGQSRLQE